MPERVSQLEQFLTVEIRMKMLHERKYKMNFMLLMERSDFFFFIIFIL